MSVMANLLIQPVLCSEWPLLPVITTQGEEVMSRAGGCPKSQIAPYSLYSALHLMSFVGNRVVDSQIAVCRQAA